MFNKNVKKPKQVTANPFFFSRTLQIAAYKGPACTDIKDKHVMSKLKETKISQQTAVESLLQMVRLLYGFSCRLNFEIQEDIYGR